MNLKNTYLLALLGLIPFCAYGQQLVPKEPKPVDKNKPSVYLSYVSEAVIEEDCSLKKRSAYRLALHNNTSKPINIPAGYAASAPTVNLRLSNGTNVKGLPEGSFVRLCYEVDSVPTFTSKVEKGRVWTEIPVRPTPPEVIFYCSCAFEQQKERRDDYEGLWIASGSSVVFAVPKEFLADGLKIYTLYNYEWEFENGKLRNNEPHHQAYFYASDIPKGK